MKHLFSGILLFILSVSALACEQFAYGRVLPKTEVPHVIICNKEFAIGFSTQMRVPLFVVQKLTAENVTAPTQLESASFKIDPRFPKEAQAALSDYVNSGFDRGHMAPFEDHNHDADAALETMFMTNVIPQNSSNNRGIWRVLETQVRNMTLDGDIYVITGPIFEGQLNFIGASQIPIPTRLFKIIIIPKTKTAITYIIPNASVPSSSLPMFISSIRSVEILSGISAAPILDIQEKK